MLEFFFRSAFLESLEAWLIEVTFNLIAIASSVRCLLLYYGDTVVREGFLRGFSFLSNVTMKAGPFRILSKFALLGTS